MELLWLLLPVAAASGWWVARREYYGRRNRATARNTEYFKGLNYLIEDKPDQAIEVFTRMAGVDRNTAEIHLILGNLFRRRGEVDRAIHIHRQPDRPVHPTADQRRRAMLELGEDYLRAGLFDRAEELFRELLEQPDHTEIALSRLIHIFQQEKDWRQAITYCDRLEQIGGASKKRETAHFCCEGWPRNPARTMTPEPGYLTRWRATRAAPGPICCWVAWRCGRETIRRRSRRSRRSNGRIEGIFRS